MRGTLTEIKRGQVGTGLLIENDGYVSLDIKDNKKLCESVVSDEATGMKELPRPFILNAVFQKFGVENANGRIYPEGILKREVERYQQAIAEKRAYGEENHPEEATINLERVSLNIIELHWEGRTLVGKIMIPITEGFRKYGIICCQADNAAHLLLRGIKIGVSSRGLGTVTQKMGVLYVADDYEIVCWDIVSCPSTPGAYISFDSNELQQYIESDTSSKNKPQLFEKLDKFSDWLND